MVDICIKKDCNNFQSVENSLFFTFLFSIYKTFEIMYISKMAQH